MEVIGKIGAFILVSIGAYYVFMEGVTNVGHILWIAPLVALGIFVYFLAFHDKVKQHFQYQAAPAKGPIKINLTVSDVTKGVMSEHSAFGRNWKRLHIDVVLSQRDWDTMKSANIEDKELFGYRHPDYPEKIVSYTNRRLIDLKAVDFPNMAELDKAKEELLDGLYALRSRLDEQLYYAKRQERGKPEIERHEI
jgi:hypothetical protein